METLFLKINRKFEFYVVILPRINIHDDSKNLKYLNTYRSQYGEHVRGEWRATNDDHTKSCSDPLISLDNYKVAIRDRFSNNVTGNTHTFSLVELGDRASGRVSG